MKRKRTFKYGNLYKTNCVDQQLRKRCGKCSTDNDSNILISKY